MAHRVLEYECTVHYPSTGSSHTKQYPFTQVQADEVGGVLEPDGLNIVLAQKLCDMWTRRGQHTSIRYSYWIPLTPRRNVMNNEQLAQLIRDVAAAVDKVGVTDIADAVQPLRKHVFPGCHVGLGNMMTGTDAGYRLQLEWYAGQLLDMVDNKQWRGINSWLNCSDKFTARKEG